MQLRYHEQAFKWLYFAPRFSAERAATFTLFESKYKLKLPAAYRELYCLDGIREYLFDYGNQDDFILLEHYARDSYLADFLHKDGMFVFCIENQYTAFWAFRLDGSDDPPVFVAYDADVLTWEPLTDTFSEYFLLWCWDMQPAGQRWFWGLIKLAGNHDPIIPALERNFTQVWPVKVYHEPLRKIYRFGGRTQQQLLSVIVSEKETVLRFAAAVDLIFYAQIRSLEQALGLDVRPLIAPLNGKTRNYLDSLK